MFLIVNEDGALSQIDELTPCMKAAHEDGVIDIVRFVNGKFQMLGSDWGFVYCDDADSSWREMPPEED